MTGNAVLSPGQREALLRGGWYSHDARWYNAVAEEYGIEAANRLNRRAARAVGKVEARRLAAALGIERLDTVNGFLGFLDAGRDLYVPPSLIEMTTEVVDDHSYAVAVGECYVSTNVQRAGIADVYECAVLDRVQGWHEAVGLPMAEDPAPFQCPKTRGEACRRLVRVDHAAESESRSSRF